MTTATTAPTATFTKLSDGTWGLRIKGAAAVGQTVTVSKSNGSTVQMTVTGIVRELEGETIARGRDAKPAGRTAAASAPASSNYAPRPVAWRTCGYCGRRYDPRGLCGNCGDEG